MQFALGRLKLTAISFFKKKKCADNFEHEICLNLVWGAVPPNFKCWSVPVLKIRFSSDGMIQPIFRFTLSSCGREMEKKKKKKKKKTLLKFQLIVMNIEFRVMNSCMTVIMKWISKW